MAQVAQKNLEENTENLSLGEKLEVPAVVVTNTGPGPGGDSGQGLSWTVVLDRSRG
jgi:hypothetical protein